MALKAKQKNLKERKGKNHPLLTTIRALVSPDVPRASTYTTYLKINASKADAKKKYACIGNPARNTPSPPNTAVQAHSYWLMEKYYAVVMSWRQKKVLYWGKLCQTFIC